MKTKSKQTSLKNGYRYWIFRIVLVLCLPLLLYYGYCWGLWGRGSLLLQYLFQCSCPTASEDARYPESVDVIVPACQHENSRLSPSGRFLYVSEKRLWFTSTYLLNLLTGEKTPFFIPEGSNHFLTDDLLFLSLEYGHGYEGGEYILHRTNGNQYPIQRFVNWHPNAYVDGDTNLSLLVTALRHAEYVFLITDNDTVVALTSDFSISPEQNFIVSRSDIPGFDADRMEQFLRENNIAYHSILINFPNEVVSPDSRFIARHDGIYLLETNQLIVKAHPSRLIGWINDSSGVIYSSSGPCLIRTNFFIFDDTGCFFEVPQPVIKLKVPDEYLPSQQAP